MEQVSSEDSKVLNSFKVITDWIERELEETDSYNEPVSDGYSLPENLQSNIVVFSDGACRGNPGPGAWGTVAQVQDNKFLFQKSGVQFNTTNNQMELQGAIEGLSGVLDLINNGEVTHNNEKIVLVSDSKYVLDGMSKWVRGWKKRGWKKADGKVPENVELWKELDQLNHDLGQVQTIWVKGHAGHPQNELCDQLANYALDDAGF